MSTTNTVVLREDLAHHNLVAAYLSTAKAVAALHALEAAGMPRADLSLLAPDRNADERAGVTQLDIDKMTEGLHKTTTTGAVAGAVAGGLLGSIGAVMAFTVPGAGPLVGTALWAGALGGVVAGGGIGGLMGNIGGEAKQDALWTVLLHEVEVGRTLVGLHFETEEELVRAGKTLDETHPLAVWRLNEEGLAVGTPEGAAGNAPVAEGLDCLPRQEDPGQVAPT